MAGSTLSFDSLSSPSPSPSPPPAGKKPLHAAPKSTTRKDASTAPTLDSDSELSELTDDDQDGTASADRRERPTTASGPPPVASSKVLSSTSGAASAVPPAPSSVNMDDHANIAGTSLRNRGSTSRRGGLHNRNTSTSRRGGGPRKKRSSLVPAPMWGWAETKATTSSAPAEEEEEEMAGPPRAMEEEEEEPDEPGEEEEDDYDNPEDSAGIDEEEEENGGFVSQRRMGPYVTQRLPGIRSIYSGRARHGRRQIPPSSRKHDLDPPEPPINGVDPENGSASGSEYNSRKKRRPPRTRPPASAGSRKAKSSATRESSGSDHPPPSRKPKKIQLPDEENDEAASDVSARHNSDDEKTKGDDDKTAPQLPVSPAKFLPSSKPLSSIASSTINPAAGALAALAVIADSVENTTEPALDLKSPTIAPSPTTRKSPIHERPPLTSNRSSGVEATPVVSRSITASPDNSDRDDEHTQPQPSYRNKRPTRRAPPRSKKSSDDWRRLGRPPVRPPNTKKPSLDLRIDTALEDKPDEPVVEALNGDTEEMDVDADPDEVDDVEKHDDLEVEEEEAEEEEASQHDEEAQPIDAGEGDDEPADPEGEGDVDEDQEQDLETNEVENEQENDNENENENEEEENEEEPSPEGDLEDPEIELQPAHRAEALDVLASIELKFAMLRERVYVEKMEILSWEESMVQASVHPEMQYLQKEMTKRRDKRLELASRKRSYEITNATKRRKADEEGVWSWWKLTVDELQTDMIAETNRKRRKLERERRALERTQPIRRIPLPPTELPLLPQPSLRKLLNTHPFGVHKPVRRRRHRHPRNHQPKNLVYPEIPTLSVMDINHDLDVLYQNRRIPSSYDMPFGGLPPLLGQGTPFSHRSGLATGAGGLPGLGRPVGIGLGPSNGVLPPTAQNQAVFGLQQPNSMIQHHPLAYEQYPEVSSYRRDVYTLGPPLPSRDPYIGYSGHSTRNHPSPLHGPSTPNMVPSSSGLGYSTDHEMGTMPSSGGPQLMPNPPYFGHGSAGPNAFPPSSSHGNSLKGVSNGRRSPPSPPHLANGMPSSKSNGNWMNPSMSMGMGSFQVGSSNGKGSDRDARTVHDDDERDRLMVRDRDRKRVERDKDMERRDYWEKDYPEPDRDRTRDLSYTHPPSSLQFGHGSGAPTPGPGVDGHHHPPHHLRNHHHHVLHRHGPPHPPSSLPSPVHPGSGGAPPIVHSPRSVRDYDIGSSAPHPAAEGIMLSSSSNKPQPPPRDREREFQWSQRNMDNPIHHSPSMHDYRDRDKDLRKSYSHRPSSRPGPVDDRGDRPMSSPFIMGPTSISSVLPSMAPSSHMNGSGAGSSDSSLKGQPIWAEDPSYRMPPAGYMGGLSSHDAHRSPVQAHRYTPGAPPGRGLPPASSIHRIVSPPPHINRARPPPSPYSLSSTIHRSPPTSPRLTPRSPSSTKPLLGSGRTVTPTGQRPSSSHTPSGHPPLTPLDPHLKNGTTTNYPGVGGRTESPHLSALHVPSSRQGLNGNGGLHDVERHSMSALSPRLMPPAVGLHPSKLSATPVADRR